MVRTNAFLRDPGGDRVAAPAPPGPPPTTAPVAPTAAPPQPKKQQVVPIPKPDVKAAPPPTPEDLPDVPGPKKPEVGSLPIPTPVDLRKPMEPTDLSGGSPQTWKKDAVAIERSIQTAMDNESDAIEVLSQARANVDSSGDSVWDKFENFLDKFDPFASRQQRDATRADLADDFRHINAANRVMEGVVATKLYLETKSIILATYLSFDEFRTLNPNYYNGTMPVLTMTDHLPAKEGASEVAPTKRLSFREWVDAAGGLDMLTSDQQVELSNMVDSMEADLAGPAHPISAEEGGYSELGEEYDNDGLTPALEPGAMGSPPRPIQALHNMTLADILNAVIPAEKGSTHTPEEWEELFAMNPEVDAELAAALRPLTAAAEQSRQRKDQIKEHGLELPTYDKWDYAKFAALQPMQAVADIFDEYGDAVFKPFASKFTMTLPWVAGGLEDEYREAKLSGASDWEAAATAWDEWDINWGYKMIPEMFFDPVSWLGFGLLARLPYVGVKGMTWGGARSITGLNIIGKADYKLYRGFDWFADGAKAMTAKIGMNSWQKSQVVANQSGRLFKKYMEVFSDGKYIYDISTTPTIKKLASGKEKLSSEWGDLVEDAIRSVRRGGGQTVSMTQFVGRMLLSHAPLEFEDLIKWAGTKGIDWKVSVDDISIQAWKDLNDTFEGFFYGKFDKAASSVRMLELLGIEYTVERQAAMLKLMSNRSATIYAAARNFKTSTDAYKTVRSLMKRTGINSLKWDKYKTRLDRLHTTGWKKVIYDMEPEAIAVYQHYVGQLMVKTFAEAYLTFGMYGPMNVIEDYMRSIFGGVLPRRMNIEEYRSVTWLLSTDPNLEAVGINEMLGALRATSDGVAHSNWFINLMMSPLSALTYAIPEKAPGVLGRVAHSTPRTVGGKTYELGVRLPGGWGADVRRHFTYKRYIQELNRIDPERQGIIKSLTDDKALEGIMDDKIRKSILKAAEHAAQAGSPDLVRGLTKTITRSSLSKAELETIIARYPDLPQSAREALMNSISTGKLFDAMPVTSSEWSEGYKALKQIEDDINAAVLDDFIHGPEAARQQFSMLADELLSADISTIEGLASITQNLTKMSDVYGSTPDQILAKVTQRSRGLPLDERRLDVDSAIDSILSFMDEAGLDVDRVVKNLLKQSDSILSGSNPTLKATYENYLEVLTARRALGDATRKEALAYRKEFFSTHGKHQLKKSETWDMFYQGLDDIFNARKAQDIRLRTSSSRLAQQLTKGGVDTATRKPVRVPAGQVLCINDVANILGCESNDISKALLGVLTAENDKDYFIGHIMGLVGDDDVGFTDEAVGNVFDSLLRNMHLDSKDASWMQARQTQVHGLMQDVFSLYNSKLMNVEQKAYVDSYLSRTAQSLEDLMHGSEVKPVHDRLVDELVTNMHLPVETANEVVELIHMRAAALGERLDQYVKRKQLHFGGGSDVELATMYADDFGWDQATGVAAKAGKLHKAGDVLTFEELADKYPTMGITHFPNLSKQFAEDSETIIRVFERNITTPEQAMATLTHELGHVFTNDISDEAFLKMFKEFRLHQQREKNIKLRDIAIEAKPDGDVGPVHKLTTADKKQIFAEADKYFLEHKVAARDSSAFNEWFAENMVMYFRTGKPPEGAKGLEKIFKQFAQWLKGTFNALNSGATRKRIPDQTRLIMDDLFADVEPLTDTLGRWKGEFVDFSNYQETRQTAWDTAEKWYYKEFTDYTNANAFDAAMKAIYPYWTYESQRYLWAPRTFMRRPAVSHAVNAYNQNTDYGNIDIPGIPVDYNVFKGTIFGPFTNTLVRKDYPNYYDSLPPGLKQLANTNNLLNHYGFYPGIHISAPLTWFGGGEHQSGELMPATVNTTLDAMSAAFPKSSHVEWLRNKILPDRFREYKIAMEVNNRGFDGGLIHDKMKAGRELTDAEKDVWAAATREVSLWGMLMEQTGMLRFRPDDITKAKKEAREAIFEMTGITVTKQDWLHRHGYRLSDMIGGWSPAEQEQLRLLEYYADWGGYNGLVPSSLTTIQRELSLDWNDVEVFSDKSKLVTQEFENQFLTGEFGPKQYLSHVSDEIARRVDYIDRKMEENPFMTPEGQLEYYKKTGMAPPIQHPLDQLVAAWYAVELEEGVDEFGFHGPLWDEFFMKQAAVDQAVPDEDRAEWDKFLARNLNQFGRLHRRVNNEYFKKYYDVADMVKETYTPDEQAMIDEYRALERNSQLAFQRANEIKGYKSSTGRKLISSFNSDVTQEREALRRANPYLDAWLIYWGKTTSPQTDKTMDVLQHLYKETGRKWEG